MKYLLLCLTLLFTTRNMAQSPSVTQQLEPGIYAEINTTKGAILCYLYFVRAPLTVANFVGLAEGKLENGIKPVGTPFYDGNSFHRVLANFMIQGGSGDGLGGGDMSKTFKDEFHPDLKHNRAGILSMANSGPNTNTSQFFITHKETPWLNNRHSVFGHVVTDQTVVNSIAAGDKILSIRIIRVGKEAEKFDAVKTFRELSSK